MRDRDRANKKFVKQRLGNKRLLGRSGFQIDQRQACQNFRTAAAEGSTFLSTVRSGNNQHSVGYGIGAGNFFSEPFRIERYLFLHDALCPVNRPPQWADFTSMWFRSKRRVGCGPIFLFHLTGFRRTSQAANKQQTKSPVYLVFI